MAKCAICNQRKGKRICQMTDGVVCSLCCGQNRNPDSCAGCEFLKDPAQSRRYSSVPRFSTSEMDMDLDKQQWTNAIESAIVAFDLEKNRQLQDADLLRILELLLDKLYFDDDQAEWDDRVKKEGYGDVIATIMEDCEEADPTELIKCIGIVRHVAKRRSRGRREQLDFLHHYVGPRVGPGARMMPGLD